MREREVVVVVLSDSTRTKLERPAHVNRPSLPRKPLSPRSASSACATSSLRTLSGSAWEKRTQFKEWTPYDVVGHLHLFNHAARVTVEDGPEALRDFMGAILAARAAGDTSDDWGAVVVRDPRCDRRARTIRSFCPFSAERASVTCRPTEGGSQGALQSSRPP